MFLPALVFLLDLMFVIPRARTVNLLGEVHKRPPLLGINTLPPTLLTFVPTKTIKGLWSFAVSVALNQLGDGKTRVEDDGVCWAVLESGVGDRYHLGLL